MSDFGRPNTDDELAFMGELQRILYGDHPSVTEFFVLPSQLSSRTLALEVAWLRTLPSGLGAEELQRRLHERGVLST